MKFIMAIVVTVSFFSVAWAEDGRMCAQNTLKNPSSMELIAAIQKACHEDDVIIISNVIINANSMLSAPPYVVAAVCKMDKQIVISRDGQDIVCVYKGSPRTTP